MDNINPILLEKVVRAMLVEFNNSLDTHVRPTTYEEVVNDPRRGVVAAAKAAIIVTTKDILKLIKGL